MENENIVPVEELTEPAAPEMEEPVTPELTVPEGEAVEPEEEFPEDPEASPTETLEEFESVSSGDSSEMSGTYTGAAVGSYPTAEEIAAALSLSGTEVIVVQEYTLLGENAKPIDQYSVTEGLLLIIVLVLIGQVISKLIGGALSCKYLFRKL